MSSNIQQQRFQIRQVYIEKVTFETYDRVDLQKEKWRPHLDVEINNQSKKLDKQGHYQVNLNIIINAKQNGKAVFYIDLQQVGIFLIADLEGDMLSAAVNVQCPNILFPFARELIAELVAKGGFPQLLLNPLDFEALYKQKALTATDQDKPTVTH